MKKLKMCILICCAITILLRVYSLITESLNPWYDILFRISFSIATLMALSLAFKATEQKGSRFALSIVVGLLALFLIMTAFIDIINL